MASPGSLLVFCTAWKQDTFGMGVRKGVWLTHLELGILQKLYYLRKRDQLCSRTVCLLICRLNGNTTE